MSNGINYSLGLLVWCGTTLASGKQLSHFFSPPLRCEKHRTAWSGVHFQGVRTVFKSSGNADFAVSSKLQSPISWRKALGANSQTSWVIFHTCSNFDFVVCLCRLLDSNRYTTNGSHLKKNDRKKEVCEVKRIGPPEAETAKHCSPVYSSSGFVRS